MTTLGTVIAREWAPGPGGDFRGNTKPPFGDFSADRLPQHVDVLTRQMHQPFADTIVVKFKRGRDSA